MDHFFTGIFLRLPSIAYLSRRHLFFLLIFLQKTAKVEP